MSPFEPSALKALMIPRHCDVVVIGGGPAGTTAATLLAQKGYDVVLFDRERHPRYRVGESLIPHTWKYTDMIGASDKLRAERFVQKSGGTVVWNGVIRQMAFKDFGYQNPALHVERDRYDYILLAHARESGVTVLEEIAVLEAVLGEEGEPVTVRYRPLGEQRGDAEVADEIVCQFVIDASGQNAVLGRQLGVRVIDDVHRFMSVWGYFDGSKYISQGGHVRPFEELQRVPPTTFVSSVDSVGDWGWMWHIPLRATTSVGLVLPQAAIKDVRGPAALEAFFLNVCSGIPYLDHLLAEATFVDGSLRVIRDYSYRATKVAGPGYFLIGDAAAFVDPIFSVAVVLAMYSATIAVWAIDRSLRNRAMTARSRELFSSQLLGRLEVSRSLALPRYAFGGEASELAREAVLFERDLEQELMYVVSTVTTRNENVLGLIDRKDGKKITSERYRQLDAILI
jgi:flavin-dependent dehydrogenase